MGDEDNIFRSDWPTSFSGPDTGSPGSAGTDAAGLPGGSPAMGSDPSDLGVSDSAIRQGGLFTGTTKEAPSTSVSGAGTPTDLFGNEPSSLGYASSTAAGSSSSRYRGDLLEPSPNKFVNLFEASSPQKNTLTISLLGQGTGADSGQGKSGEPPINSYEASSAQADRVGDGWDGVAADSLKMDVKGKLPNAGDGQAGGGGNQATPVPPAQNGGQGAQGAGSKPQMRTDLGDSVKGYESGGDGVASVSKGVLKDGSPDPGGVSYGTYQLNSQRGSGTVKVFLDSPEGKKYASEFAGKTPGSPEFTAKWKEIAAREPEALHQAEKEFIYRTHYLPRASVAAEMGFDMNNPAIQDAVWSGSVQHGKFGKVLEMAKANDPYLRFRSADDQLRGLYEARASYSEANRGRYLGGRYPGDTGEIGATLKRNDAYQEARRR